MMIVYFMIFVVYMHILSQHLVILFMKERFSVTGYTFIETSVEIALWSDNCSLTFLFVLNVFYFLWECNRAGFFTIYCVTILNFFSNTAFLCV